MALIRSLAGIGVVVSTTELSEAAAVPARSDVRVFRCYAGIAPITKQSGKSRRVFMRYGCNHCIRETCYHWTRTSVQRDANSRSHYQRLKQVGQDHGRVLRSVCDRLISVLMAVLRTGVLCSADLHRRSVHSRLDLPASALLAHLGNLVVITEFSFRIARSTLAVRKQS